MKFFTVAFFLLPTLIAKAQEIPQCRPGFEPVEFEPGSGEYFCRQIIISCPLNQTPYKNPETNADSCCPSNQQLVMYDENLKTGVCCGADQVYLGIKPNGRCCKKGEILQDGKCLPAPPPSGCQGCPTQPPGACALKAACGDNANTGLQYGSCYQLKFPNGQQLGRGVGGNPNMYTQDGYIQNIPYRVCKFPANPNDCGTGPVKAGASFAIEDGIGPAGSTAGERSWMDNVDGGAHMQLTTDATKARKFNGKTSCSGCQCVVQLISSGYACPAIQPGITIWANPKVTLKLQFLEVPCDGQFSFPQLN
ncbi:cysteine-rich secreted protein [Moniliophthora roreri MCA 2997]|uniref:Cysteine-rich secreted protein n=1 Tax=Moniliophthora roreri (strain MCA 2997) TaxID=1381753 RepID=V2WNZ3_MONRO|nr:cysteine-rich secreted protein [Moniliophthora roreri MCA 2997]